MRWPVARRHRETGWRHMGAGSRHRRTAHIAQREPLEGAVVALLACHIARHRDRWRPRPPGDRRHIVFAVGGSSAARRRWRRGCRNNCTPSFPERADHRIDCMFVASTSPSFPRHGPSLLAYSPLEISDACALGCLECRLGLSYHDLPVSTIACFTTPAQRGQGHQRAVC